MKKLIVFFIFFLFPWQCFAVEYYCPATQKFNSENVYTKEEIDKGKFAVKLEEAQGEAFVSRCSFAHSQNKITCDRYEVDEIKESKRLKFKNDLPFDFETDGYEIIKKYYYFYSQYDFQLFPNMFSVENNGRGGIQYGKCEVVSP